MAVSSAVMIMKIKGSKFIPILFYITGLHCMEMALTRVVPCMVSEQEALLKIKEGFKESASKDPFSSWTAKEDCCKWRGVGCDNATGHVTFLDLHSRDPFNILQGEINQSLLDLPYLRHLDLSQNNFNYISIPEFIGSLQYIEYLNLSDASFRGTIPSTMGNLSHLESLDLSGSGHSLRAKNLNWVYRLSSLKVLDLGGVDLSNAEDWLNAINLLPSLVELRLFFCNLDNLPQNLHHVNFTSLKILELSLNNFNSTIPDWLFDIGHSLVYLNLSRCQLQGLIPNGFRNLTSLNSLDLSKNNLEGPIPLTLGLSQEQSLQVDSSSSLRELYLFDNRLNGSLEQSLAQFSQLVVLDVSWNYLEGNITEAHLLNFSSLQLLDLSSNGWESDLSSNRLVFNVSSSWIPPFQLETIGLRSCLIGPQFPQWLQSQNNLSSIDISNAGIAGVVPDWFWNLSSKIKYMNLSFNHLKGSVPDFSSQLQLSLLDLSSNYFQSPLPHFTANLRILVLAANSFFGPISHLCGILSVNNSLSYLDLSKNNLSGEIPDCWKYGHKLIILNLASNNLSGQIPNTIGQLISLKTLRLDHNRLSGEVPFSLKNCNDLIVLGLANNRLWGNILAWIGEHLQNLMILQLRSNAFNGSIPWLLCQLNYLKILDLASNNLSGTIPQCVFVGMTSVKDTLSFIYYPYTTYTDSVNLTVLFSERTFRRILPFIRLLDLSSNNLSGQIPKELMSLTALVSLNLSSNHLVGPIPPSIVGMRELEALDLSLNHLSCTIPPGIIALNFLEVFDVSHNNLSGGLPPMYAQFSTFESSSYIGNSQLCGAPLSNICSGNESFGDPHCSNVKGGKENQVVQKEEQGGFQIPSFYLSMGLGFITGFWVFWGSLLLNRSWRHTYFRFLCNVTDKIYVTVVVGAAKLQRKFQLQQDPQVKGHQ